METKEEILMLRIPKGQKEATFSVTPVAGRVMALVAYHNQEGKYINLALKNDVGAYITKPQHTDQYRSREVCYYESGKPVDFETQNRTYTVEVISAEPMEEDFIGQLIFVYQKENRSC